MKIKFSFILMVCLLLTACNNVGFQINIVPPEITPTLQVTGSMTFDTPQATPTLQVETPAISPTPLIFPSPTSSHATLGGASALLFSSNRGGDYLDLYLQAFGSNVLTRLTQGESNTFAGPFSPDGKKIVFTGFGLTESYVGVMNADGSDPVDLTALPDVSDGFPTWSPDGSQIAFTSRRDGNNEIYLMDAYGHALKRLTFTPGDDFAPSWSPDGKQIAFLSDRDGQTGVYSIYIMNAAASWVKRLTDDGGNDYAPAWSPDGATIVFRSDHEGQSDIFSISVDGSNLTNLTNTPKSNEWSPAWSPDGTLIAFQTDRDGNWEIYTMQANGADPLNFTNNPADDEMPFWKKADE